MLSEEKQRKQSRKRRAETDEECIDEMFSLVEMEQDHDGYHGVQPRKKRHKESTTRTSSAIW